MDSERTLRVDTRPSFLIIALFHTSFHLSCDYVTVSASTWGEPWFPQCCGHRYFLCPFALFLAIPTLYMMQSQYLNNCADGLFHLATGFCVFAVVVFWFVFGLLFFFPSNLIALARSFIHLHDGGLRKFN